MISLRETVFRRLRLQKKARRQKQALRRTDLQVSVESLEDRIVLAAGDLDLSYGTGGLVLTDFGGSQDEYANDLVVRQSDGKILAAGFSNGNFELVRYNADGTTDNSFGPNGNGKVIDVGLGVAQSLALDGSGNVVVAGDSSIVRYTVDGLRDTSFGVNGLVNVGSTSVNRGITALAIDGSNRVVVAGNGVSGGSSQDFTAARYNANGTLDVQFASVDFSGGEENLQAIAIDSVGRVIVAGYTWNPSNNQIDFGVVRYNTAGGLDTTFGSGGKKAIDFNGELDAASGLAIDANNNIIVGGSARMGGSDGIGLARLKELDGSLDTSFGTAGKVIDTQVNAIYFDFGLALDAAGRIVAGTISTLARYTSAGSRDTSFGNQGSVSTGNTVERIEDVAIQSDGKILVVGYSFNFSGPTGYDFAVARYIGDQDIVNTPPVVDLNGAGSGVNYTAAFVEDAGAKNIADTTATITDLENASLTSLTLVVSANPDGADESLTVADLIVPLDADLTELTGEVGGTTFRVAYDAASWTFTITVNDGTGAIADFESLLRGITYDNSSTTPNTTTRTITVTANDGTFDSTVATSSITVEDVIPATGTVQFTTASKSVAEYDGTQTVTVSLIGTGILANDVTIEITATDGAATNFDDYSLTTIVVTFEAGTDLSTSPTQAVSFTLPNDTLIEGSEDFTLDLGLITTGLDAIDNGSVTQNLVTISDDDSATVSISSGTTVTEGGSASTIAATLHVTTDGVAGGTATLAYEVTADLSGNGDYSSAYASFLPGAGNNATSNITVSAIQDTLVEGAESFTNQTLSVTGPATGSGTGQTITVNDDDIAYSIGTNIATVSESPAPQTVTFTVSRSGATTVASTVYFTITGTAARGSDYANTIGGTGGATGLKGTISFAIGQSSKTITLSILDDSVVEFSETILTTLSNARGPATGTITISTAAATTTITDNEPPTIGLDGSGGLLIQDSVGNRTDRMTVTYDSGTNSLVIADPNNPLPTGVGTIVNAHTIRVPLSALRIPKVTFNLAGGDDKLDIRTVPETLAILINSGDGNDTIYGNNSGDTINSGNGKDSINAGSGNDVIDAGIGNDTVFGGGGTDNIIGGDGADYLSGDAGNDTLIGGADNDTLLGGDGNDSITGDAGADSINGGKGNDTLDGGSENDTIRGSSGNDAILGGSGNDQLFGESDNDTIAGGTGNDAILGGAGNDVLAGGAGVDRVLGESGSDTIAGGSGSGKDVGDVVTDLAIDIKETLMLVFSNGVFIVTL